MNVQNPLIEIRTGSDSDMPKIKATYELLNELGLEFSARILSAHRTPNRMASEARNLSDNGFRVCIAAAGGSAHLPGMTASETSVPVIGLPVYSSIFSGLDALYSIIQMPNGIPVGTVGPGCAKTAAVAAAQIVALDKPEIRIKIRKLMSIKNPLPEYKNLSPLIGIVRQQKFKTDEKKYAELRALLSEFGISCLEMEADEHLPKNLHFLELSGGLAIISIGHFDKIKNKYLFPATGATDLPVIGMPVWLDGMQNEPENSANIIDSLFEDENEKTAPINMMGFNRYINAALYAAQIAGLYFKAIGNELSTFKKQLAQSVIDKDEMLKRDGITALAGMKETK